MKIAVDFDGTIVEHRYPEIGKEVPFATVTLRKLIDEGHKLILWSVREGKLLDEAVAWCEKRGVHFYAVNKDFDEDTPEKAVISAVKSKPIFLLTTAMSAACQTGALSIHSYIAA